MTHPRLLPRCITATANVNMRRSCLFYHSSPRWSSTASSTYCHHPLHTPPTKLTTPPVPTPNPSVLSALRKTPFGTSSPSPIQIFNTPTELRPYRNTLRTLGHSVALVPTMGAFHAGHLSLARTAALENSAVFISIYVNPTQFGVTEDLAAYPRTFPSDLAKLEALNAELAESAPHAGRIVAVFAPSTKTMYPSLPPTSEINGAGSFVTITPLGTLLEGAARPVFFRGVATVCTKLFNITQPDTIYFGQKDVQQTAIIRRLVRDFHIPTTLRIIPTSREPDGLAMSSRNVFLGMRRRAAAAVFPAMLQQAAARYPAHLDREAILQPARDFIAVAAARQAVMPPVERARFELEYVSLADGETMEEVDVVDTSRGAVISAALRMLPLEDVTQGEDTGEGDAGGRMIRLIDNIILAPLEGERPAQ